MGNHGQTEGGGAFSLLASADKPYVKASNLGEHLPQWYALWTHSHCEQLVRGQLDARGFEVFLPTIGVWSWRAGVKHELTSIRVSRHGSCTIGAPSGRGLPANWFELAWIS